MHADPGGCQILIVEDSPEVAEAFSLLLEQEGYRVSTTANGREALALLRGGERPKVVFVDLVMPILNGFQLIDVMKQDDELVNIPVVAVTASMYRARGVFTVKKPFAVSGLLEAAKFYCAAPTEERDPRRQEVLDSSAAHADSPALSTSVENIR